MTQDERLMRPIRIAHVIQNLNYGGMERVLHTLARQLPPRGFEVHVAVLQYLGHFAEGLENHVTFHQMEPMSRSSLVYPGNLIRLFRRLRPDIVHSHAGVWMQAARAATIARVPVMVHTEHGRPSPIPFADRLIDHIASRWTDTVISVSEPLAVVLRREVVRTGVPIVVIANGVEVPALRPDADRATLRAELGLPPEGLVIGSVGRLEPIKNYRMAIRALALLPEVPGDAPPPMLVIAGDGSERGSLEALANDLGIGSRVRFLGWRSDTERLYGAFDLFTLPSRSEGTSISLLEAMSAGVCPVVTDVGGNRVVLGPELEHLLVPDDDPVAIASAWRALLADHPSRTKLADLARSRVFNNFSLAQMVERHAGLYRELLRRRLRA